jgi:hypothetical protein
MELQSHKKLEIIRENILISSKLQYNELNFIDVTSIIKIYLFVILFICLIILNAKQVK